MLTILLLTACADKAGLTDSADTAAPSAPTGSLLVDVIELADAGSDFGAAVAGAGDVDGDGYDDLLVGHLYNLESSAEAWLLRGGPDASLGATRLAGADPSFGATLAGLGDGDGDGLADFAVGAWSAAEVTVYGFEEGAEGEEGAPDDRVTLREDGSSTLGYHLAGPGDFDGDGLADLAMFDTDGSFTDSLRVCQGSEGWSGGLCNRITVEGGIRSLSAAGDLDGDGLGDLAMVTPEGAILLLPGQDLASLQGVAVGWDFGDALPLEASAAGDGALALVGIEGDDLVLWRALGSADWSEFVFSELRRWEDVAAGYSGAHVIDAGDVDVDGSPDLAVSLHGSTDSQGWVEVVDVVGETIYVVSKIAYPDGRDLSSSATGWEIAAAGDVDGDGRADVLIGGLLDAAYLARWQALPDEAR